MTPTPKLLSIIVPVFQPDYILFDKVLKALCEQSLREWELVVVMDGPDDEASKAVARAFKKVPNHYRIVEVPHGGVQKARNHGFRDSVGEYVLFWDCDCLIEPHAAQAWVDILNKNPEVGFVYAGYKFLGEKGAINAEQFDPWLLRVRNYISTCFPVRRSLVTEWNESLESLQDWDFWLGVVERGGIGKFMKGYAFSTAYPTPKSISGKGCSSDVWLSRMDKVKALHNIPIREVCVTSLHDRLDAIALAKALDADYDDRPNDKVNHYKTIIQIGFSVKPNEFERCASAWGKQHRKVIFWTADDIEIIYHKIGLSTIEEYSKRINALGKQYVEDNRAREIMTKAGFAVEVLPLPVISKEEVTALPEKPSFLVDISEHYGHALMAIDKSIPDIALTAVGGTQKIEDYTGIVCFHKDRMLRPSVKRMLAAGRHVLSNIQAPFTGFLDDHVSDAKFVREFVDRIRAMSKKPQSKESVRYWIDRRRVEKVLEAVK